MDNIVLIKLCIDCKIIHSLLVRGIVVRIIGCKLEQPVLGKI